MDASVEQRTDRLTAGEDLLAGALAGCASRMVVAPLDVIKIRFQVQNEPAIGQVMRSSASTAPRWSPYRSVLQAVVRIAREEGWRAFFKGNVPALAMVAPYASVQFATFYQLRQQVNSWRGDGDASVQRYMGGVETVACGIVSGMAATLCTYPLDLLRTRLAAQGEPRTYHGVVHAVRTIGRQEGVRGFYQGLSPTLVEIVPYVALQLLIYEKLRHAYHTREQRRRRRRGGEQAVAPDTLQPVESLIIGAVTGTVSKLLTLPLDNAKKRMQVQGLLQQPRRYRNTWDCCVQVYRTERMPGLFRGTVPSLLKAAPASGIAFLVYERLKAYLLRRKAPRAAASAAPDAGMRVRLGP
ncbi:hypothetical protein CDCA_CDCA17G4397 [Cyanidium caldarium]|uniref:Mitochondrial carrier protein n=1 Tax=Cyanidium caldarium TaxID=2771 RepID=A0AAV9J1B6_CYACA|nr:hypothetical protein CDCA_CDCA17G4397 [Cyanidium caldarium]